MVNSYPKEIWKELDYASKSGLHYAVSNFGRVVSYASTIEEAKEIKCGLNKGYKVLRRSYVKDGRSYREALYVHKLVAELFLPKQSDDKSYVLHQNFVKNDNRLINLKWANKHELEEHQNHNPKVISDRKRLHEHNKLYQYKLSEAKVKVLKRKLLNPNRRTRLKMIARMFGVSEMQLHRIKTGENWGHVKP